MMCLIIAKNTQAQFGAGTNSPLPITVDGTPTDGVYLGNGGTNLSTSLAIGQGSLISQIENGENVAIGWNCMNDANFTGYRNVGLGYEALKKAQFGRWNIAVGHQALFNASTLFNSNSTTEQGNENIGIGAATLFNNNGSWNIGIGSGVLKNNLSGNQNIAIGYSVLSTNQSSSNNIGIGNGSMQLTVVGGYNIGVGNATLSNTKVGSSNCSFGLQALGNSDSINLNCAYGQRSMYSNDFMLKNSVGNSAYGTSSLGGLSKGDFNVALGYTSLSSLSTGNRNIALGTNSLVNLTSGNQNIGIGYNAQVPNPTGTDNQLSIQNIIYGKSMDGSGTDIIRTNAKVGVGINSPTNTLDINGTMRIREIPNNPLSTKILCIDGFNVVNQLSLSDICSYINNNCGGIGEAPCTWNVYNNDNVTMGYQPFGYGNPCRIGYTGIGTQLNTLIRNSKGKLNVLNFDGSLVETKEYQSGTISISKDNSERQLNYKRIGLYAYGAAKTTNGGYRAESIGVYGTSDKYCTTIQNDVTANIGVYGGPTKFIACIDPKGDDYGMIGVYSAGRTVLNSTPIIVSDSTLKTNVTDLESTYIDEVVRNLRPVSFNYRQDVEDGFDFTTKKQYGFLAQEVEKVVPDLVSNIPGPVSTDDDNNLVKSKNDYKGVVYENIIAILVKAVQNQNQKITDLQNQINNCCTNNKAKNSPEKELKLSAQSIILENNVQQVILYQNTPNPFSEKTTIRYQLPENTQNAEMKFYDALGNFIKSCKLISKGIGSLEVFGNGVAAGIYTYSLFVDGKIIENKKMVKQ